MIPYAMVEIREYLDARGDSPFAKWLDGLNAVAAAKVTTALVRMGQGNLIQRQKRRAGVFECRMDFGPGYRVYFGRDGDTLIILLAGGSKKRQQRDIEAAKERWRDYKARKRTEI